MESLGWVGPDVWYAHGIHMNDEELQLLADTGTGVAHCPNSNMKLHSGVCRIPDMLRRGVKVGLAVDGSASNDGSNMMDEIRSAYLLHRLTWGEKAPSGYDMPCWAMPMTWGRSHRDTGETFSSSAEAGLSFSVPKRTQRISLAL